MTETYDAEHLARRLRICADDSSPISAAPELLETSATALAVQAEEIERLLDALKVADNLVAVIVQSPVNVWYVDAVDPETTVCDAEHAIRTALGGKQND